ncbi:MAG: T9SS type A sorting domain-containing protein [Bacteroidetes bacterium]|nr:T9SS type A sorting domain-containing protein [Bacteroidota bacterium]
MKLNKIISFIAFFAFLFCGLRIEAQSNLEKYWYYRHRLISGFTKVGSQQGESMVAPIRNWHTDYHILHSDHLHFGDQTIYMGWYLGVLATEYALLKSQNLNLERTKLELYYALKALIRIDEISNIPRPYYNYPVTQLDGFFLRDDVANGFVQANLAHFNKFADFHNYIPVYNEGSDYESEGNNYRNKEMSQDQVYHILLGLALIKTFVDDAGLTINLENGERLIFNFNLEARNYTHLLISKIKADKWVIKNPGGNPVNRGSSVAPLFPFPLAEAGNFITGHKYYDAYTIASARLWKTLEGPAGFSYYLLAQALDNKAGGRDNLHLALTLASISNSYSGINITGLSSLQNWDSFYPLLRYVLHEGINTSKASKIKEHLDSSPCLGPWSHNGASAPDGWGSPHRFIKDKNEQEKGQFHFQGVFTGLDFMLLHNLYYIVNPDKTLPAFEEKMDIAFNSKLEFPYQINGIMYGDSSNPANIEAFRSISCSDITIKSNGVVYFRAGEFLNLNCKIEDGAKVEFLEKPFNCANNQYMQANNLKPHRQSPIKPVKIINPTDKNIIPFIVFPNPFEENFTLYSPFDYPVTITFYNFHGVEIRRMENINYGNTSISLFGLSSGLYIMKLEVEGRIYFKKIIKT